MLHGYSFDTDKGYVCDSFRSRITATPMDAHWHDVHINMSLHVMKKHFLWTLKNRTTRRHPIKLIYAISTGTEA